MYTCGVCSVLFLFSDAKENGRTACEPEGEDAKTGGWVERKSDPIGPQIRKPPQGGDLKLIC